jgi:chromosome segregation ATPase
MEYHSLKPIAPRARESASHELCAQPTTDLNYRASDKVPFARDSASHDECTRSTVRHSSATSTGMPRDSASDIIGSKFTGILVKKGETLVHTVSTQTDSPMNIAQESVLLRQQVKTLQEHVEVLQRIIETMEKEVGDSRRENKSHAALIQSLQEKIDECIEESERHKKDSERHRHELWVFARLFSDRKASIAAEHQADLKCLQDRLDSLVSESYHTSRQCLRYSQHNQQLCQLVDSLNLYIADMEIRYTDVIQIKASELGVLHAQHCDALSAAKCLQSRVDAQTKEQEIVKAGISRAAAFLAALGARDAIP